MNYELKVIGAKVVKNHQHSIVFLISFMLSLLKRGLLMPEILFLDALFGSEQGHKMVPDTRLYALKSREKAVNLAFFAIFRGIFKKKILFLCVYFGKECIFAHHY